MRTPAEAACAYLARGWQVVAIPAGLKGPQGAAWHEQRLGESDYPDLPALFPVEGNIGIILGAASGGLVDVDLDCDEAVRLADCYLPPTAMISGRPSRRRSHWWYVCDKPQDTRQYRAPDRKMVVELRSSAGQKGFQTLAPPSLHPSSERVEWEGDSPGEPARIGWDDLSARVRILSAAALLARHFPTQGGRHEFALALGGSLLQHGVSAEDAHGFVWNVCAAGGSDDPDKRAESVYSSAEKLAAGEPVTGLPRLAEIIDPKVVKKAAEWLDLQLNVEAVRAYVEKLRTAARASVTTRAAEDTPEEPNDPDEPGEPVDEDTSWLTNAKYVAKGKNVVMQECGYNAYIILSRYPALQGMFRWNDVTKRIDAFGPFATEHPDVLDVVLADFLCKSFDVDFSKSVVADRLLRVAFENHYDPIADYLNGLHHDGAPRIDRFLLDVVGVRPESKEGKNIVQLVEKYSRRWFIATAARALEPGCKMDNVLVLEGEQSLKKSALFRALFSPWFSDTKLALDGNKDSLMRAAVHWGIELAEMASVKNARSTDDTKGFLSAQDDDYRLPYGRALGTAKRRCVFVGTLNPDPHGWMRDQTGNRRYWPVHCTREINIPFVQSMRDQLWAEAVAIFRAAADCPDCKATQIAHGCAQHRWWFERNEQKEADEENRSRELVDAWLDVVRAWWVDQLPDKRPTSFDLPTVARQALKLDPAQIDHRVQVRLGGVLAELGFEYSRPRVEVDGRTVRVRSYHPTEELLALPQSDAGKARPRLDVVRGGRG